MEVKSTTKYVRLSPKKARDVAREIQGLPVLNAMDILTYTPKKAAVLIGKTLKTAISDAENNFNLDTDTLVIKEAVIGAGPTLRRFAPRAKGSGAPIKKRTSHITITLIGEKPEKKARPPVKKRAVADKIKSAAADETAPEPDADAATETPTATEQA